MENPHAQTQKKLSASRAQERLLLAEDTLLDFEDHFFNAITILSGLNPEFFDESRKEKIAGWRAATTKLGDAIRELKFPL